MTDITLRPYQQEFIDNVRNEFLKNHKHVVGVAPCGAGKTIMTGWMIRESLKRNKSSIFFVHRHELIEQTAKTFSRLGIEYGIISAGYKMQPQFPVQIASVQTLAKRIDQIPPPDFLICDECHHILANTYKKILDAFPNSFLLGVTATPQRMGGITLCDVFTSMIKAPSVNELINLGNLTDFKYFAPDIGADLQQVRINKFGEFDNADLEQVMNQQRIIGGIIDNYLKLVADKSTICYCVNVNHSKAVADAFNRAGIQAAHCDGETPKRIRADIVENFRQGKIKVLCNAELFGEGFDVPLCQAVILARPTKSLTLYIQQAMRAMRPDPADPDKVAFIIDHVQNYLRHGLPNENRHWSLEPNAADEKKKKPRKCPCCNCVVSYKLKICPICGCHFPEKEKYEIDTTEYHGELVQIDTRHKSNKETSEPRIIHAFTKPEELLAIAEVRNYKIGWVAFNSLKYAKSYEDCLHIADICNYNRGWAWHNWNKISEQGEMIHE